jgi:murein DD-endopeptidase MepM/ murein hydrolase activator NlpD
VLTLPFDGRWRVLWGGDTKDTNRHYGNRSQQYALEFVVADRYGRTYEEEGKKNEDYFAFGRPVLAPAAGRVIGVVQGVEDNKPGSPNPYSALGNAVIIQHSTNEVSVISHLKHESIVVKMGEAVDVRQPVGLCGNSGDTEEPRIHFHLQDSPVIQTGSGYRLVFDNVLVWNRRLALSLAKYTPIQGSYVEQQLLRPKEPAPARDRVEAEQASK